MVLDKFKSFVKDEDEKKKKGKKLQRDTSSAGGGSPISRERRPDRGGGNRSSRPNLGDRNQQKRGGSGDRGDLGFPSEKNVGEDLPELPGGGSGEQRGDTGGGRERTTGPSRTSRTGGGSQRRRTSPQESRGGMGRGEEITQKEALQRILQKLEDIDRKLDRLQGRR